MYSYIKRQRFARLKVGLLVSAGLLMLITALLFSGSLGDLFVDKVRIHALFDNIQGLRIGSPVRFSGLEIGRVISLEFVPNSRIRATLEIDAVRIAYLKTDSRADILTLGLLGDKYVSISTGSPTADRLKPGDTIAGAVELGFQDVVESTEQVIGSISTFIQEFQETFGKMVTAEGTLTKLLSDPDLYESLKASSRSFAEIVEGLNRGRGTLGQLLTNDALYRELTASARSAHEFTARLADARGSLKRFVEDPGLYNQLNRASTTIARLLADVEAGRGSLGRLVKSETLHHRIEGAVQKLDNVLRRIENGEGMTGRLLYDDRFFVDLSAAVEEIRKLSSDIRQNPDRYFQFSLY